MKNLTKPNQKPFTKLQIFLMILTGSLAGGINGLFGGGGGMVIVPLLISVCGYLRKNAHANALVIMLPVSIVSIIVYLSSLKIELKVLIPVVVGFCLGGIIGAFLLSKIKENWLKFIFGVLIIVAGGKMLFF